MYHIWNNVDDQNHYLSGVFSLSTTTQSVLFLFTVQSYLNSNFILCINDKIHQLWKGNEIPCEGTSELLAAQNSGTYSRLKGVSQNSTTRIPKLHLRYSPDLITTNMWEIKGMPSLLPHQDVWVHVVSLGLISSQLPWIHFCSYAAFPGSSSFLPSLVSSILPHG